ncbi:MAG: hypothetical protein ACRDQA_08740 [Nocardioidaceae bacterium]
MSSIDHVLERLVNEPGFRDQLTSDPEAALAGHDLSRDDLDLLASALSSDVGADGGVEARQSKSAMGQMLGVIFQSTEIVTRSTAPHAVQSGATTIDNASAKGRKLHKYVSAYVSDVDAPGHQEDSPSASTGASTPPTEPEPDGPVDPHHH